MSVVSSVPAAGARLLSRMQGTEVLKLFHFAMSIAKAPARAPSKQVVFCACGILPRCYRGWSRLRQSIHGCGGREPLSQRTTFLADKVVPGAIAC
jgi:hypothetical protein